MADAEWSVGPVSCLPGRSAWAKAGTGRNNPGACETGALRQPRQAEQFDS